VASAWVVATYSLYIRRFGSPWWSQRRKAQKPLSAVCIVAATKFFELCSGGYRNKPHRRTWMQFSWIRMLLTYLSLEDSGRLN
jgi:hypothetical protein